MQSQKTRLQKKTTDMDNNESRYDRRCNYCNIYGHKVDPEMKIEIIIDTITPIKTTITMAEEIIKHIDK